MIKFVLHGGFSSGRTDEDNSTFYKEILSGTSDGVKILLVPFAKDEDGDRVNRAISKVTDEFKSVSGNRNISIVVADRENFISQIKGSDIIYFHGGVSVKLLGILKEYPELREALEGKVVAGESAGANVWSSYFYSTHADEVFDGLGFLPIKMIPHYKEEYAGKMDGIGQDLEEIHLLEYEHRVFAAD